MEYSKYKASANSSGTDSTDSYAVIGESLTTTSDEDDDFYRSNANTQFSRDKSTPYLRSNSSSILRHASPSMKNTALKSAQNERIKSKTRCDASQSSSIAEGSQQGFNKNDLIVSSLKSTFADILVPFSGPDDHLVSKIQGLFDTQEDSIDFLEKELGEKKSYLKKLRAHRRAQQVDKQDALPLLLAKYPVAMNRYRKKIEDEEYKKEHERCAREFEVQRQDIIRAHKHNYKVLKDTYEKEYKRELKRIRHQNEEVERDIKASFS
jgi:hypothetical protein